MTDESIRSGRQPMQVIRRLHDAEAGIADGAEVDVTGMTKGAVDVEAVSGSGSTVNFEGKVGDNPWKAVIGRDLSNTSETYVTTATADKIVQFDVSGLTGFRARITVGGTTLTVWASFVG